MVCLCIIIIIAFFVEINTTILSDSLFSVISGVVEADNGSTINLFSGNDLTYYYFHRGNVLAVKH